MVISVQGNGVIVAESLTVPPSDFVIVKRDVPPRWDTLRLIVSGPAIVTD